jgi:two-component system chemotaxis sensor kinase CheA
VSLVLEGVDALKAMIPAAAGGEHGLTQEQRTLLERLRLVERHRTAARRPEAREPEKGRYHGREDGGRERTLRVDIAKLDRMLTLTGEIAIAQGRLRQLLGRAASSTGEAEEAHEDTERLCLDLQELVMKARMVPLGPVFRQYLRVVRDVSASQGKQVRLVIEGEDVEVDTAVAEHIRDPITHMIRNAIDHGIELPHVREALGKNPGGCIKLSARHSAGSIVIELEDDGAGLDRSRIATQARARGLVTDPEAITEDELCGLVFEPGLSTADTVTELSGRGIGLDVVRRSIEALRGTVGIESREGRGRPSSFPWTASSNASSSRPTVARRPPIAGWSTSGARHCPTCASAGCSTSRGTGPRVSWWWSCGMGASRRACASMPCSVRARTSSSPWGSSFTASRA